MHSGCLTDWCISGEPWAILFYRASGQILARLHGGVVDGYWTVAVHLDTMTLYSTKLVTNNSILILILKTG